MTFEEVLDQAIAMLQRRGRLTYGTLKRQFQLDDAALEDLKNELIEGQRLAVDEDGRVLVWTGGTAVLPTTTPRAHQPAPPGPPLPTQAVHPPQTATPPAPPPSPDAERRQLTVLFCDLVDSTARASRLDPEDLREVVRAYQATCAEVIQPFGGYIAQYLGDGLLLYFGYPHAHEDDAQRAVRASLGMLTALQALNTRLEQDQGIRLAVRLGIHTGLVVVGAMGGVGRQEQLALGETPNIAARLQGLATPDTVVISEATAQLVHGYFVCQALGAQVLKGLAQPLMVYRVLHESGAQTRLDVAATRGLTRLVGREQEIGLLAERWERATEGMGQVVVLTGEAGIGKSRLAQVLRDQIVGTSATRIECRCSPQTQQSALYPVITHLEGVLAFTRTDTPTDKLHKLEDALTSSTVPLADLVPLFAALLSLPPPAHSPPLTLTPQRQHQKTLEALLTWLGQEADQHPVLCIVEDLHWVDPSTLEFLSLLVDQSPTARIMVLLTCRPEFTPPWPSRAHLTSLTLTRLPRPQVERMVASVAGAKALPRDVAQQIVAKTDGVPLFVEELTKTVLESGLLEEHEDHYELTGPLPALAIPATLQDSLMARLDRLSTGKAVAQLGATLGRQFAYDLLQAIAPLDEGTLQQGLRQLVEAELLYQRGLPPQATYSFKHALIQDTAYQSLLKSTRQHYHQRIAQVLETRFADVVETQPELLAHHYTEAGCAEQAVAYWQRAGQRARQRVGEREAITHFRKGVDVLQTLPHTRERIRQEVDMLHDLIRVLGNTQGLAEAAPLLTRARVLCEPLGDTPQLFWVLYQLRLFNSSRAEHQTARECAEQALTLAQRLQDPALFPSAHQILGLTLLTLGDLTAARGHFEQALACYDARRGNRGHTVQALSQLARTLWLLGYPDQAVQRNHEALRLEREPPTYPVSQYLALYDASTLHQLRREVHAVHEQTEAAIALVAEEGASQYLPRMLHRRGWVLAVQGQYEEGIAQMSQALTALRVAGAIGWVDPSALAQLAEAYGQSGRVEAGLSLLAEAQAAVDQTGDRFWEAEVQRLTGELLLRQAVPDEEQAEACFQQALDVTCHQQAKSLELRAAMNLSCLWQRQGKRDAAHDLLAPIYGWFTEGFETADLQDAKALLDAMV